ncbi:Xanthine dehydrogenase [Histomonas meleagridis]|uniref:Xanthine dehydrogenase n=1 Tax=Histomonas meleagridis TaxID=135588 RepID=UPI00355A57A0|nr:Xanthine dehydrogenase [Histomonas meleagridis]KAH0801893.1 Xanthine dehydrogenase [Histomonas meleagridis]
MVRILAHRNGEEAAVVLTFEGNMDALLAAAKEKLGATFTRAFLNKGAEITDTSAIEKDDDVYFSTGADFIEPAKLTERERKIVQSIQTRVRHNMIFYVNGKRYEIENPDPEMTLLEWLRFQGYTSVKKPCGEGGCGGCAVAVAEYDTKRQRAHHFAVNSCLVPLPFVDGCAITTAEGVGQSEHLHRIQKDLAEMHGTQCGFCTPGIVTTLYALFAENPERTIEEINEALSTNLCRCTGYRPIFDAARRYAIDFDKSALGELTTTGRDIEEIENVISTRERPLVTADFPEELINFHTLDPLLVSGPESTWFAPSNFEQVKKVRASEGAQCSFVNGATDLNFKKCYHPDMVWRFMCGTRRVDELKQITPEKDGVYFGSSVSINEFGQYWETLKDGEQALLSKAITTITKQFANYNIRNIGTIGGSLCAGDALSDLCPILMGLNAQCNIVSLEGESRTVSAQDFVLKRDLKPSEILYTVFVPFAKPNAFIKSYKICRRREDSQALCNCCFNIIIENKKVTSAHLAIGAVAAKQYIPQDALDALVGKEWNFATYEQFRDDVLKNLQVSNRVGQAQLRLDLVRACIYKYFLWVLDRIQGNVPANIMSASIPTERKPRTSHQDWEQRTDKVLGQQPHHISAYGHTTGEAKFVADIDPPEKCAYAYPVLSTNARAEIESIDASQALALEGVIAFVSEKDIPGAKKICSIPPADEDVFAIGRVNFYGQVIGVVVAETEKLAIKGARLVKVTYKNAETPIVTIYDALDYYEKHKETDNILMVDHLGLHKGNVKEAKCKYEVTGQSHFNNQEHFYLEPNSMLVVPQGTEGWKIYAACQNPGKIQDSVAAVLNVPRNMIRCEVMRLGGGFGGKQDRPQFYAAQAAMASYVTKRPIRLVMQRQDDIATAGMRHEYVTDYDIGCDENGMLTKMDFLYHSNAGWTMDLSRLVMDRTLYSATGGYSCPNVNSYGNIYRTNKLSCTAFRGFGVPQSLIAVETAMAKLAHTLGVRPEELKEKNLYHKGDKTLTGYELPDETIRRCWEVCKKSCDWDARVKEVEEFNKTHVYKKRGIAMTPVVSTMGFESEFMMKGQALVQIYGDGSVTVSHGGIEMGQGIHTKMAMIAAETLGIDYIFVKVLPTATDKTANMPPTAGSTGTDLHGRAVENACKELRERLQPIRDEHPDWTWPQVCGYAYFNKFDMQSSAFNKMPNSVYNHETHEGRESFYLIWSVAFSMVEIDVLTGEHVLLRADLVHDCGSSINPGIDIGQLEGGFVQGQGLYTLEEMIWAKDGHIRTRNVTTYKIPTLDDIPDDFRVTLLHDDYNNMGVVGSKASGEAGLRMGCSVLMALRDAVTAARAQFGVTEWFDFHSPATIEVIREKIPVKYLDPEQQ